MWRNKDLESGFGVRKKIIVVDDVYRSSERDVSVVSTQNGNDAYSSHSPKIIIWKD